MANTVTKMMASDFNKFSGGMSNFYSTLFGTPAADVARGLCEKFGGDGLPLGIGRIWGQR